MEEPEGGECLGREPTGVVSCPAFDCIEFGKGGVGGHFVKGVKIRRLAQIPERINLRFIVGNWRGSAERHVSQMGEMVP